MDIIMSSVLCGKAIKNTKIKFEGVDYLWAAKYIAMSCSQDEIDRCGLHRIVPRRKSKKGTRPTIVGVDIEEKVSKWKFLKTTFTEDEKKELLAKVVEVAVKTTFRNHLYQFEGKMFIQAEGGSIGLRLTGVVAKIVMNHWMEEFKKLAIVNDLTL